MRAPTNLLTATLLLAVAFDAASASAQYTYSEPYDAQRSSPEHFAFEFRVGGYSPDAGGDAFSDTFGGDIGPMIGLELDFYPYRIPYVGLIGAGLRFNWAKYSAQGCVDLECNQRSDQEVTAKFFPLQGLAVLRIDVLARELNVPLVFVGKLGLDMVLTTFDNGGRREHESRDLGLHWGAQVALELDFINPARARSLDDEWGINHSYLFFELFGSTASFGGTSLAWTGGLALTF